MSMKLAIHHQRGSFSERWIQYCIEHGIEHECVNCFDSDILRQLEKFDGLLWHWTLNDKKALLVAKQIIVSAEKMGLKVFPNIFMCWHYNDKIAQKYILESIAAPLVPSYVFYSQECALAWIEKTEFPKVFKLSCGAGSQNVKLVKTRNEARNLCRRAFGKGFNATNGYFGDARSKVSRITTITKFIEKLKRMPKAFSDSMKMKEALPRQKGYIYFQDFLPDNDCDTRITVIGDRVFGFQRKTRTNDFRASGSGHITYDMTKIDKRCLQIAFETTQRLKAQSLAFDFIFNLSGQPEICEISYCYLSKAVHDCPGYWDRQLRWYEGHIWPENAILDDLINQICRAKIVDKTAVPAFSIRL